MDRQCSKRPYIGIYGNIALSKEFCRQCEAMSFVIDGYLACCGKPAKDNPERYKRESIPEDRWRLPHRKIRMQILADQANLCFYCFCRFGSLVKRRNRLFRVRLVWDHQIPYVLLQNNQPGNIVAACRVCNGIKGAMVFQTIEEARLYVQARREAKGYVSLV